MELFMTDSCSAVAPGPVVASRRHIVNLKDIRSFKVPE